MILFPPAKINLGLRVLRKRNDGFHEIETCMYSFGLYDVLEIMPSHEFKFVQTGLEIEGDSGNNLVVKAFRLVQERYKIGNVYVHLRKNIPMGAGLGGGSADAAFMLMGLDKVFSLGIGEETLLELASELGSDCAFFIKTTPQIATGRGEVLKESKVDLSGLFLKVIHPGIHIGTAEAYSGVQFGNLEKSIEEIMFLPVEEWQHSLKNGFEGSIFPKHDELSRIKSSLYEEGALYASMTGSGSTMYGLFKETPLLSFPNYFERIFQL